MPNNVAPFWLTFALYEQCKYKFLIFGLHCNCDIFLPDAKLSSGEPFFSDCPLAAHSICSKNSNDKVKSFQLQ